MSDLALIIPTFNERANVVPLLELLDKTLDGIDWEAIFVDDDSRDGTAGHVRSLARQRPNVRVLQRIGRRGLSSACIEGMLANSAPYLAVMDADLQHDERVLPQMLAKLREGFDIVVASRNVQGGGMGEFAAGRQRLSNLGRDLSRYVCKADVSDPMSGFFMLTREYFEEVAHRLSGISFKILVDLLASSTRPVRLAEVPYTFRNRIHGESKLDTTNLLEYLFLLADKTMGAYVPVRYAMFAVAGLAGAAVHLPVLGILFQRGVGFIPAQAIAAITAMVVNFFVNNFVTYRDLRLKGRRLWTGLFWFLAACSIGGLASVAISSFLFDAGSGWFVAGLSGLMIASVWNYAATSVLIWRQSQRK